MPNGEGGSPEAKPGTGTGSAVAAQAPAAEGGGQAGAGQTTDQAGKAAAAAQAEGPKETEGQRAAREAGEKHGPEVKRLHKVIGDRDAENKRVAAERDRLVQENQKLRADKARHPALEGLQTDDEGRVMYHGAYHDPDFVIEQWETTRRLQALEQGFDAKGRAEETAETKAVLDDWAEAVHGLLVESVDAALGKDATPERRTLFTRLAEDTVQTRVHNAQREAGGNLPEASVVQSIVAETLDELLATSQAVAEGQMKDNQDYADRFKTSPKDGQPGSSGPPDVSKMTRVERERYMDAVARDVERRRTAAPA